MGTSRSFAEAGAKLDRIISPATMRDMAKAAGDAAAEASREAATRSLGGDRAFSNMKRGGSLDVDVDVRGEQAVVNHRPAALWRLAEGGRRSRKLITADSAGVRAFRTPQGPREWFHSGPSRGLRTLTNAQRESRKKVGKAADEALRRAIGRVI